MSGNRGNTSEPLLSELSRPGRVGHMLAAPGGVQNFQSARSFFETGLARYAASHATNARILEASSSGRHDIGIGGILATAGSDASETPPE